MKILLFLLVFILLGSGISYASLGDEEATQILEYSEEAEELLKTGRYPEAIIIYHKILELYKEGAYVYSNLATSYYMIGRYEDAIRYYKQALEIKPGNPRTYVGLGTALEGAKQPEKAEEAYHAALKLDPENYKALFNLAAFYEKQDKLDQAMEFYEEALEIEPDDGKLHYWIAKTLFKKEDYSQAWKEIHTARDLGFHDMEEGFLWVLNERMEEPLYQPAPTARVPIVREEDLKSQLMKNRPSDTQGLSEE